MKQVAACGLVLAASLPVGWLLFKCGLGSAATKSGRLFQVPAFFSAPIGRNY